MAEERTFLRRMSEERLAQKEADDARMPWWERVGNTLLSFFEVSSETSEETRIGGECADDTHRLAASTDRVVVAINHILNPVKAAIAGLILFYELFQYIKRPLKRSTLARRIPLTVLLVAVSILAIVLTGIAAALMAAVGACVVGVKANRELRVISKKLKEACLERRLLVDHIQALRSCAFPSKLDLENAIERLLVLDRRVELLKEERRDYRFTVALSAWNTVAATVGVALPIVGLLGMASSIVVSLFWHGSGLLKRGAQWCHRKWQRRRLTQDQCRERDMAEEELDMACRLKRLGILIEKEGLFAKKSSKLFQESMLDKPGPKSKPIYLPPPAEKGVTVDPSVSADKTVRSVLRSSLETAVMTTALAFGGGTYDSVQAAELMDQNQRNPTSLECQFER